MINREIDKLLSERVAPEARPELAERIVLKTARLSQERREFDLKGFNRLVMEYLGGMLIVPRPVLAFAVVLIFGGWLGMEVETTMSLSHQHIGEYLEVDEQWF